MRGLRRHHHRGGLLAAQPARAEALIVVEAESGRVLYQENATYPWYPASVTKLMTMYVALKAVKEGRMQLDTLLTVSPIAASQAPSKMGFKAGHHRHAGKRAGDDDGEVGQRHGRGDRRRRLRLDREDSPTR